MNLLFNTIFPRKIDNNFCGNKYALYFFYFLSISTLARSQTNFFDLIQGAQSIAGVSLNNFTVVSPQFIVSVFSLYALSQTIMSIIYLVCSIKFKSLVPMLYLLMILEYMMRLQVYNNAIIFDMNDFSNIMNLLLFFLLIIMFILCIPFKKKSTVE